MPAKPLYVCRPVLNAAEIIAHFKAQGFNTTLTPEDMHVTIAYSKARVDWNAPGPAAKTLLILPSLNRTVEVLGDKGAVVLKIQSSELHTRWQEFRQAGASWDYDDYRPHVTITYEHPAVDLSRVMPYLGEVRLGPERFQELDADWSPAETAKAEGLILSLPVLVKAASKKRDPRRIVEVEASTEEVDMDGDLILQKALLGSAESFIGNGHLDIDHLSEFGARMGLADPASYIVGRPLEVKDLGGGRTSVVGEIRQSLDGVSDPRRNRYDDFWESLHSEPPVEWRSSVYGFPLPGMIEDCSSQMCYGGATRYLVKGFDWRSLAFTRNPKNTALQGYARIVTAKSFILEMAKSLPDAPVYESMESLLGETICKNCGVHGAPTTLGYREHFKSCRGFPDAIANIYAHATMHGINQRRFSP